MAGSRRPARGSSDAAGPVPGYNRRVRGGPRPPALFPASDDPAPAVRDHRRMTAEGPVEFRAAKSGLSVADWLAVRTRRDARIYAGAGAVLLFGAVLAVFGTYGVTLGLVSGLS